VIVRARSASSVSSLTTLVEQVGGVPGRVLPMLDALAAEVPNLSLTTLIGSPIVLHVAMDRPILSMTQRTSATTGAAAVRSVFGYDGAGVGVAVIDSGITGWHDDLARPGTPGTQRVDRFVDLVNGAAAAYDDYGHGTHVAGIIAGNGFDSGGARAGMAPSAHLVVLKVLDGAGRGRMSDVIAAFEHVIEHRHQFNIRVVNLSIAAAVFESYDSDLLTLAARRAVEAGLVVVAAAGNAGRTSDGRTQYGAITAPGNAPWVLTVGASSHMGTTDRSDDTIAAFSSRGPTAFDRAAKPDVVAPGVGIVSLSDPHSAMFATKSPYLVQGTVATGYPPYLSLSGTSQAAPVVTGTVALMLQANPALTPNAVKAILQYTAEQRQLFDGMTQGSGFLNARGAVELARFLADPAAGSPVSPSLWSRAIRWGNQRLYGGGPTLNGTAWMSDVVWGAPVTPAGQAIVWGLTCTALPCGTTSAWIAWEATCGDSACASVVWDRGRSINVVWGTRCGGADCEATAWSGPPGEDGTVHDTSDDGDTVVWGTSDSGDTIVWGTNDSGETVVWGTSCGDPSCVPVMWESEQP
jgi:serine protease AprX